MAAGGGRSVVGSLSIEDVWTLDETVSAAIGYIFRSADPRLADAVRARTENPKAREAAGMLHILGFIPSHSPGAAILLAIVDLNTLLQLPTLKLELRAASGAIRKSYLALSNLDPTSGGNDPEVKSGFKAGFESDIATVLGSQRSDLSGLGVLSIFMGNPLWPTGVPASMASLFADWESMLRERFPGTLRPGRTVESTITLVKSLWDGDLPFEAFLDVALRERLGQITERKNALPQVLALAPRELASRLAVLASRDTKLLPVLASPTKATLEGVVKSHGPALLEGVRPELGDVADPLWLAWYAGALGRVMGGMQKVSPVVPTAEPVEAKAKSEPRSTPVVKRAPAKAGSGSRPTSPSSGAPAGDAVKRAKPSRPMPKKK
jgi:hypothetical protein